MSIKSEITKAEGFVRDAYQACEEMGATIPQDKNLENLAPTIRTITGGSGGWDPQNPTLDGLKDAVNKGTDVAAGTEIPDTFDGHSNPIIVGDVTTINGKRAIGILRKFVEPVSIAFGSNSNYQTSTILSYLNNDYYNKCSDGLKAILSQVSVKWFNGSDLIDVSGKWHLFSGLELGSSLTNQSEGNFWQYWKNKTGKSAPFVGSNNGRSATDPSGTMKSYWLRSYANATQAYDNINDSSYDVGVIQPEDVTTNSATLGVLPMGYIVAD